MNSFSKALLALTLTSSAAMAQEQVQEGFDYQRGKLEGRATVAGRIAFIQITGEAAESMYYQMTSPIQKNVGCTSGNTKQHYGMSCTNYKFPGSDKPHYECWINLNLKTGNLTDAGDACPDLEYDDPYWDARGNNSPRSPDFPVKDKP